jgi:hypothetical protein
MNVFPLMMRLTGSIIVAYSSENRCMKPSTLSSLAFKLLRSVSTNTSRSIITCLFLLGLWQVNPDVDEFLMGAIPTVIGIVWAWGTGAVRELEAGTEGAKRGYKAASQESSQEFSVQSDETSKEKEEKVLDYLLKKGAITKRQHTYTILAKEDEENIKS